MRKRIAGIAALAGERARAGALLLIVGPAPASAQEGDGEAERRAARIARYLSAGAVRRMRTAAAGALLPVAALACAEPARTSAPKPPPTCEKGEPDCSPHPFDVMAINALHQRTK